MIKSRKDFATVAVAAYAISTVMCAHAAFAHSSSLSVTQIDPAQARQIAATQTAPPAASAPNQSEAASALAEIINRFAAGEPIDPRLVASANALSAAPADDGNIAVILQAGDGNQAAIEQKGKSNDATIVQRGDQNASSIEQTGNNNIAEHVQIGNGLALEVTQNGDATVFITQGPQ